MSESTENQKLFAGVSRIDITPEPGVAVNLSNVKLKEGKDQLFARALVLKNNNNSLAIVSIDQILFASEYVIDTAKHKWGIDHVITCSSHTHAAMAPEGLRITADSDWTREGVDPKEIINWQNLSHDSWYKMVEEAVIDAIGKALQNTFEAKVAAGTEKHENQYMAHNRRLVKEDGSVKMMWANPERIETSPIDPSVRVVRIDDTTGKTRVLLAHYACHPVMMMNSGIMSRDYPGAMVDYIEKNIGSDCTAMFLQGADGDLDPYDLGATGEECKKLMEKAGQSLGEAALKLARKLSPVENADLKIEEIILKIANRKHNAKISKTSTITAIIGKDLAITTAPGEFFIQHQLDLSEKSPIANTLLVGYAYSGKGSPFILYIPTEQAAKEGGYGAQECSFVEPKAGEKIIDHAVCAVSNLLKITP